MKKSIVLFLIILLSVGIFLECSIQQNMLSQEDIKVIRNLHDVYEKFVVEADWNSVIEFYAEDSVRMRPGEPAVIGKEAILAKLKSFNGMSWEYRERPIKIIEGRGDLAFVWSIYKGKGEYGGHSFSNSGGFLQVFRQQHDGTWKIIIDVWSYDE